ncbi:sugar nucleotide-binding protein [Cedecea sp. FDAARGOS_727]|uniref:sugar nucleotide-binding protein n=1 Tax=Cedecea sp. FDAARGOS_727 TaxID=2545798 RepID=UPI00143E8F32|nr:sugar nucleotide-binding protein [Cedecea sp. FDAARGOS_727]QIX97181.1 sugar nucleotide-binding protein [Cedecea sp. FDAARGOS_727]
MKRIFILGSSGYVGNHLKSFLCDDFKIVTAGRKNSDVFFDLEDTDNNSLLNEVTSDDTVVFLSAISAPDECEKNYQRAYNINVKNSIKLISALLEKKAKIIFSSSDVVFGDAKIICDELSEKKPFGKYGNMKSEVEDTFSGNKNFFTIRFSYILGKGDKFSEMVKSYSDENKELDVFDGFERNVISINDVLLGIRNIILNWDIIDTRVVNFSGPELISRQKIVLALHKEKYTNLKYQFTDAPDVFWLGRPKQINTKSIYLESILERECESYLKVIKG